MVLEIELYHEMIISATQELAYRASTYEEYFRQTQELDQMALEYLVLLDIFVEEVEEQKKEANNNIYDLEIEKYYRMAKSALEESYIMV